MICSCIIFADSKFSSESVSDTDEQKWLQFGLQVKGAAQIVVANNNDGGIAEAIERYIL